MVQRAGAKCYDGGSYAMRLRDSKMHQEREINTRVYDVLHIRVNLKPMVLKTGEH